MTRSKDWLLLRVATGVRWNVPKTGVAQTLHRGSCDWCALIWQVLSALAKRLVCLDFTVSGDDGV